MTHIEHTKEQMCVPLGVVKFYAVGLWIAAPRAVTSRRFPLARKSISVKEHRQVKNDTV